MFESARICGVAFAIPKKNSVMEITSINSKLNTISFECAFTKYALINADLFLNEEIRQIACK